jgi:diguanylate cyclase (GGDEF)-like protein
MRIGRKELLLVIGLVAAIAVAFSDQLSGLPEAWRSGEGANRIGFLPGLAFIAIVLLVYVQTKRREVEMLAVAVAEEARQAQDRTRELERLVALWRALTQSLDMDAVRETVSQHLPDIACSPNVWIVTGEGGTWTRMLGPAAVQTPRGEADIADLALGALGLHGISEMPEGVEYEGQLCFPLVAAGATLGTLGVPVAEASLETLRRQVVGAAAALVAVSVRSANLLRDVRKNSLRDSLTGCSTRAYAMEMASAELKRARRSRAPVSLLMIDVDHFKSVNDQHGHLCGDAVLAAIGTKLRATLRSSDLKCRYGGEEFLAVLPDTPREGAVHAAEMVRRAFAELEIPWHGQTIRITTSLGVATARANELDPTSVIARADAALYLAKRDGRNCVRAEDDAPAANASAM